MNEPKQTMKCCVSDDGRPIAWSSVGAGPALVLGTLYWHGAQAMRTPPLRDILLALAPGRRLITYDGLGSGLSDRCSTEISIDHAVRELNAVLDAAGLERCSIIAGLSGSHLAVRFAALQPGRVQCLVIVGGTIRSLARVNPSSEAARARTALAESMLRWWDRANPAFRTANNLLLWPDATPAELAALAEWQRLAIDGRHAAAIFRLVSEADVSSEAGAVRCPTLVVHARGDQRCPFAEAGFTASAIPGAQLLPLESVSNFPIPSDPAFPAMIDAIRDFLAEHGSLAAAAPFADLTPRERDVLELLARGLDNLQIAARLVLSEKSIRNRITAIFDKLAVENRGQAIVKAREAGLGVSHPET